MSGEKRGQSYDPTAFTLVSASLINHAGEIRDIRNLISEILIRESLLLPTLIADITISDTINFFESFALIGQESIILEIERHPIIEEEPITIQVEFFISEYPEYIRSETSANQQAYTLRGISAHAYNSKFQKISRKYSGSAISEITKIVTKDLFSSNYAVNGADATSHKGIINIQEPLSAIEYFRKMAFDENGAPFYFWQSINGRINLSSLSSLINETANPVYNSYVYLNGFISTPNTFEDYIERSVRIRNLSSKLGLSKLKQSVGGAYASRVKKLDLSTKTYTENVFNYDNESGIGPRTTGLAGEKNSVLLSKSFKIGRNNDNTLNTLPDSHCEYLSTNKFAFGNPAIKNYTTELIDGVGRLNSFYSKLDTMTQTIELCGDFELVAGRKIRLLFPKSMEASTYKNYNADDYQTEHLDLVLSGVYMISGVNHKFELGVQTNKYTCNIECKKDSVFSEI